MSDALQKDRSPRSPNFTLEDAIAAVGKIYAQARGSSITPEIAVRPLGYGGLNGAAGTALATLGQYGLITRASGNVTVSPLAVKILYPKSEAQLAESLREAALAPPIMLELFTDYLDCGPAVIEGHLIQNGFSVDRAKRVAAIHMANKVFANLAGAAALPTEQPLMLENGLEPVQEAPRELRPSLPEKPTNAPESRKKMLAEYNIPLGANEAKLTFTGETLAIDDFDALIDFVEFTKRQFQRASRRGASEPKAGLLPESDGCAQMRALEDLT